MARRSITDAGSPFAEINLAGRREELADRNGPDLMRAELVQAEQAARYAWTAPLLAGRRVLDAGCGLGGGAAILREAGAREVLGIDIADAVVDAARPAMPPGVSLESGDLRSLRLPDRSFDVVVCMDTIGRIAEPAAVLDELARVLAADGVLVVSIAVPSATAGSEPGDPGITPAELELALRRRFARVEVAAQRSFAGSVIAAPADADAAVSLRPDRLPAGRSAPRHVLALAGDGGWPPLSGTVVLGAELQEQEWLSSWAAQQQLLDAEIARANDAERRLEGREELARRLLEAEQLLADTPARELALTEAIAQRDHAIGWARARVADLEAARQHPALARLLVRELRRRLRRG